MRIALVSREYRSETATGALGSPTHLKARGLVALGHEVFVLTRAPDDDAASRTVPEVDGIHVICTSDAPSALVAHTAAVDWIMHSTQVAAELGRLQERVPLDLVEFAESGAEGCVHLLNRIGHGAAPVVVQLHGPLVMAAHLAGSPEIDSELYRVGTTMESTCVRLADAVYASSACAAQWCAEHYGVGRDVLPVMHPGVDLDLFRPRVGANVGPPTIAITGELLPNKGVVELVEAACQLVDVYPKLRVLLVGRVDTEMERRLRALAARARAPELLEFAGDVTHRNRPEYLARAHVFALPSVYEPGPGVAYLEAMACGLPIIACEGAGAEEVVRNGDNGLLVPPRDVDAVRAALKLVLGDDVNREAMGAAGRSFVERQADSRACVRQIEAYYRRVINSVRRRRDAVEDGAMSKAGPAADDSAVGAAAVQIVAAAT